MTNNENNVGWVASCGCPTYLLHVNVIEPGVLHLILLVPDKVAIFAETALLLLLLQVEWCDLDLAILGDGVVLLALHQHVVLGHLVELVKLLPVVLLVVGVDRVLIVTLTLHWSASSLAARCDQ